MYTYCTLTHKLRLAGWNVSWVSNTILLPDDGQLKANIWNWINQDSGLIFQFTWRKHNFIFIVFIFYFNLSELNMFGLWLLFFFTWLLMYNQCFIMFGVHQIHKLKINMHIRSLSTQRSEKHISNSHVLYGVLKMDTVFFSFFSKKTGKYLLLNSKYLWILCSDKQLQKEKSKMLIKLMKEHLFSYFNSSNFLGLFVSLPDIKSY